MKDKILDILEQYGLRNPQESVGQSAFYCDLAILLSIPSLLWISYVEYYFPARPPINYAICPFVFFITFIVFRTKIHILAMDLEAGARSYDAWKDLRNTILPIGTICIIFNAIYFGYMGNNLSKILSVIYLIPATLSLINILTFPIDKSEYYRKLHSMKIKIFKDIIEKLSKIEDRR